MFHGYYDFLLKDIRPKPLPTVLHHKTCPTCGAKLVNVYLIPLGTYICKKCIDKLSEDGKGGE